MTFMDFPSNLILRPRLFFRSSDVMTMKLDVIFPRVRPEIPSKSAALYDGKYRPDLRLSTSDLN